MTKKIVLEVKKNLNENNPSVLRRFSRKVQEFGFIPKVKKNRYNEREESKLKKKKNTLRKIIRRTEIEKLKRLGKIK